MVSFVFGWLLIAYGFFLFVSGVQFAGVWGIFLGWFLSGAAASASEQNELKHSLQGMTIQGTTARGMTRSSMPSPAPWGRRRRP